MWQEDRGGHVWPKDREVVAEDGTRVRYTVRGSADPGDVGAQPQDAGNDGRQRRRSPEPDRPWLVFCAGFLCPDNFWQYLAPAWMDEYRCLFVNYRGVGASTGPDTDAGWPDLDRYRIADFASDVLLACEAEGATEVVLVGHSMGCQVALEVFHQDPHRVAGLSLLTGPFASPLNTFYGTSVMATLFPLVFTSLWLAPRFLSNRILPVLKLPVTMPAARLIRALGPLTPGEGMELYFDHASNLDPRVAMAIANGMNDHDASSYLPEVDVPVFVVTGGKDTFSPPELGDVLQEECGDVTVLHLPDGTHGALLEYPDEIRMAMDDWLDASVPSH